MKDTKALLLAAGLGTRLKPLTDVWPKCLMPIQGRPLLEYWLNILEKLDITDAIVNTHYLSNYVHNFLGQSQFKDWVSIVYEKELLGTAGTIRQNTDFCKNSTILLAHADNWTCCDFSDFIDYHHNHRPKGTVMTMMTFTCSNVKSCGVVELDSNDIVVNFHEKVENPPGHLANAAVYLLEPEVINWINNNHKITDFSTEVVPKFLGKIATWENKRVHRDIGTINALKEAQLDRCAIPTLDKDNAWQQEFLNHPIHRLIEKNDE